MYLLAKSSSKLTSSESNKLSVLPGASTHPTGTVSSPTTSTRRPTNFGLATTQTKRGYRRSLDAFTGTPLPSFFANKFNFESNTPLNLNHAVWNGGPNVGPNRFPFPRTRVSSASDADGGRTRTPKKREKEKERVSLEVLVAVGRCLLCGASVKVLCRPTSPQGPNFFLKNSSKRKRSHIVQSRLSYIIIYLRPSKPAKR